MSDHMTGVGSGDGRRAFLRAAAAATGGVLVARPGRADHPHKAGEHPAGDENAAFQGVLVPTTTTTTLNARKNIAYLPAAELGQLREAFRVLRANNDAIYNTWVNLHVNNCQHNNNRIWPWHRAYLYYFERRLRTAVPGASPPVTLPFWSYDRVGNPMDTAEFRRLPTPYRPQTVGGQTNPLWVARAPGVNTGMFELPPAAGQTAAIVAGNPLFSSFTVNLENQPHNNVHNQLGLPMQHPLFSPRDPVFWLHHANLDRAWEAWRAVPGHQNLVTSPALAGWRLTPLPGFTGAQFPRRLVQDFLSTADLEYTYVDQLIAVTLKGEKGRFLSAQDVDLEAAKLPAVPDPAVRPVSVRFEQVQRPTGKVQLQVRVFLGVPDATADTPLDSPGLVGMFTLFPTHIDHGPSDPAVTVDVDATDAVGRLIAEKKTTKFPVTVVVVPSAEDDKVPEGAAELRYKGVRVVIGD